MQSSTMMSYILIIILLVCGYIFFLQIIAHRTTNRAALPLISVLFLILYLVIAIPFVIIIFSFGSLDYVLLCLLSFISCVVLFTAIAGFFRHFRKLNKAALALFLTYTVAVAYITIFSRDGTNNDTSIYMIRMDLIQEAIRTHSLEPLNHVFLNLLLFVPMGILLPYIYPEKLARVSYAALMGLMCTTIIESIQMMLGLGQADLTDVITNAAGAVIGFGIYRLIERFRPVSEPEY